MFTFAGYQVAGETISLVARSARALTLTYTAQQTLTLSYTTGVFIHPHNGRLLRFTSHLSSRNTYLPGRIKQIYRAVFFH